MNLAFLRTGQSLPNAATFSCNNTRLSRPIFWGLAEKQLEAGCALRNAHAQVLVPGLAMRNVWGKLPPELGSEAGWCGTRSQAGEEA